MESGSCPRESGDASPLLSSFIFLRVFLSFTGKKRRRRVKGDEDVSGASLIAQCVKTASDFETFEEE